MRHGLKHILEQKIIALEGEIFPYSQVEDICRIFNYRISNAERRLRELTNVEPVMGKKGFIVGYRLIAKQGVLF